MDGAGAVDFFFGDTFFFATFFFVAFGADFVAAFFFTAVFFTAFFFGALLVAFFAAMLQFLQRSQSSRPTPSCQSRHHVLSEMNRRVED